jgi:AraC-like DNA-binding protein
MELVVNLGEGRMRIFKDDQDVVGQHFDHSVVCGPHSRYFVLDTSRSAPAIGIHFRPGGATPFFNLPADELTDRHIALEDLWGPWAHEMHERLTQASSPEHMFRLLEHVLLSRLRKPHLLHPAVAYAVRTLTAFPDVARIRQVQNETGYAAKRFIELFSGSVGLTPKVYSRIQRFQAVINHVARGDQLDWAGVALDGGYYDQSHLNREFRTFSGITPALYQPVAKHRPSHVAV